MSRSVPRVGDDPKCRPGKRHDGASQSGQASPRDNVVFEAGLFGGALGIRRTFILHAHGSKLPSDLLGLTSVRYDPDAGPAEVRAAPHRSPVNTARACRDAELSPQVARTRKTLAFRGFSIEVRGCPPALGST
jgi:predicted nucleotide-binding protein